MTKEEQHELECSMTLERLGQCIVLARPQNSFINDRAIEAGWLAQPDYEHKHLTY